MQKGSKHQLLLLKPHRHNSLVVGKPFCTRIQLTQLMMYYGFKLC